MRSMLIMVADIDADRINQPAQAKGVQENVAKRFTFEVYGELNFAPTT